MEKSKIIDEILAEWAMRSHDGLVGGHDTPENIAILSEMLTEKQWLASKFVKDDPENPGKKIVVDHPLYDDGVDYEDVLNDKIKPYLPGEKERYKKAKWTQSAEDAKREELNREYFRPIRDYWVTKDDHPTYQAGVTYNDVKYNRSQNRKKQKSYITGTIARGAIPYVSKNWTLDYLANIKGFKKYAQGILDAFNKHIIDADIRRAFIEDVYNNLTPDEAVAFMNNSSGVAYWTNFFDELDTISGQVTGDGEYPLVLLIKGAKTAGGKSGDIQVDNRNIDVKKVTNDTIHIPLTAVGGRFEELGYIKSLNQLVAFCRKSFPVAGSKYKTIGEALVEVCENAPLWNESVAGKFKDETVEFFKNPSVNRVSPRNIYGLELFAIYMRELNPEEKKEIEVGFVPNTVEFDLNRKTSVMQVQSMPPESQAVVTNPSTNEPAKEVSMTVAPITTDDQIKSKLVIPQLQKLDMFSPKGSADKIYTPDKIAKEMFAAMYNPPGTYTGGIIFKQDDGFFYEKDLTNLTHGTWYYAGLGSRGLAFVQDTPEELTQ